MTVGICADDAGRDRPACRHPISGDRIAIDTGADHAAHAEWRIDDAFWRMLKHLCAILERRIWRHAERAGTAGTDVDG